MLISGMVLFLRVRLYRPFLPKGNRPDPIRLLLLWDRPFAVGVRVGRDVVLFMFGRFLPRDSPLLFLPRDGRLLVVGLFLPKDSWVLVARLFLRLLLPRDSPLVVRLLPPRGRGLVNVALRDCRPDMDLFVLEDRRLNVRLRGRGLDVRLFLGDRLDLRQLALRKASLA